MELKDTVLKVLEERARIEGIELIMDLKRG